MKSTRRLEHKQNKANDKIYYYHEFADEEENITEFRTLHSKCYAYNSINKQGEKELNCVIAGVTAKNKGITREHELKTIDNLKPKFKFIKNGGTRCVYIEKNEHTDSCAIIVNVEKTLNNANDALEEIYERE